MVQTDGFEELYDLAADPCERVNLAGEDGQEAVMRAMREGLYREMLRVGDCRTKVFDWLARLSVSK